MQININVDKIKAKIEENPILAIGATAALLTATSKLLDANTNRRNSKVWAREVDRRLRK